MNVTDENLESLFGRYADRPFLLVRPGGNWGDELIYWGARSLADRLSIKWQEIGGDELPRHPIDPSSVIYIHGGGGFNPYSSGRVAEALFYAIKRHQGVVIQGPQTFVTERDQLASLVTGGFDNASAETVIIFVRESASLRALVPVLPDHLAVAINEDTAFYISRDDVERRIGKVKRRYNLMAIRRDSEGIGFEPHKPNQAVTFDPAYFATSFDHWLRLHAAARRIVTNRTHSSILGAILGTPTALYAGRYHKNRSIWEYSLKERGVQWLSENELRPRPETLEIRAGGPLKRIGNSWKVQRLGKWLQGVPLS